MFEIYPTQMLKNKVYDKPNNGEEIWDLPPVRNIKAFIEEETYSPAQANKEDLFKATHFTKLTNSIRNVYMVLMVIFIGLTLKYLYNSHVQNSNSKMFKM